MGNKHLSWFLLVLAFLHIMLEIIFNLKYSQTCLKGSGKDKKWLLNTGDPLIQAHFHCILCQVTEAMWLLKTGVPLEEVTT